MISGLARGLPVALDCQSGDKSWQMSALRPRLRLLDEQTVLILGFGAIARRLVELLRPLEIGALTSLPVCTLQHHLIKPTGGA